MLNHPSLKAFKSNPTRVRCSQITWQVLEETRLFFRQLLGTNDFTNKGPRIFSTSDLGGLIKDLRCSNFLDSVTIPKQCNNKDRGVKCSTLHGNGQGASSQANGAFSGAVPILRGPDPYSQPSGNVTGAQTPQGRGWQAPILEHCHPVFIKFMARFLQKYSTPYLEKLLISVNKTVRDLPKFGGNIQGKRYIYMHHILAKCINPNFNFYHVQEK